MYNFIAAKLRFPLSIFLLSLAFLMSSSLFGQDASDGVNDAVTPSNKEKFVDATDLVIPWRSSGCHSSTLFNESGCHVVTEVETLNSHMLTLYNPDGSIWYRFSVSPKEPDYFLAKKKKGFKPFATHVGDWPLTVILRMTRESPNWYEVEVNEKTRATKFVSKNDPMWAKVTWNYWLHGDTEIRIDNDRTKLRDKPDGKVIEESANLEFKQLVFLKADGDWAFVEGFHSVKTYRGWIRWRKDREILVGCAFNSYKVE